MLQFVALYDPCAPSVERTYSVSIIQLAEFSTGTDVSAKTPPVHCGCTEAAVQRETVSGYF